MTALKAPSRDDAFVVFGQKLEPRVDVAAWQGHAERFFATHLTLASDARLDAGSPWLQAVSVVVAPIREGATHAGSRGARACWCRPMVEGDARAALEAESRTGLAGLSDLAKRCKQVWLVSVDDARAEDLVALRIAAILAGVTLGPILAPGGAALFGPKTARVRLT